MAASSRHPGIIAPAALSFLAIYNPSLGTTDETLEDQIVYYWAKPDDSGTSQNEDDEGEKKNRRLRQIGLAQGMIEFAKYSCSSPCVAHGFHLTHTAGPFPTAKLSNQLTPRNPGS